MEWQNLPEIAHDQVKLGGDVEVFLPDWSNGIPLPNNASEELIEAVLRGEK